MNNLDHIKTFFNSVIHEIRTPTDQVKFKINEAMQELNTIKESYNKLVTKQSEFQTHMSIKYNMFVSDSSHTNQELKSDQIIQASLQSPQISNNCSL